MSRSETTYVFVDGSYIRKQFASYFSDLTDETAPPDIDLLKRRYSARKIFYYDCLHDLRKASESEEEFDQRVERQKAYIDELKSISGCQVYLGTLKKGKQPRQKEVDVMLAVDVLQHAYNKNYDTAVLVAGDLDFRPLVGALIQHGVFVRLFAAPTSVFRELRLHSDQFDPMTFGIAVDLLSHNTEDLTGIQSPRTGYDATRRRHGDTGRIQNDPVQGWKSLGTQSVEGYTYELLTGGYDQRFAVRKFLSNNPNYEVIIHRDDEKVLTIASRIWSVDLKLPC